MVVGLTGLHSWYCSIVDPKQAEYWVININILVINITTLKINSNNNDLYLPYLALNFQDTRFCDYFFGFKKENMKRGL